MIDKLGDLNGIVKEGYVVISMDEYNDLLDDQRMFWMIQNVLYADADLSWNGKELSYDISALNAVLNATTSRYGIVLSKLQSKKEKTDGEHNHDTRPDTSPES